MLLLFTLYSILIHIWLYGKKQKFKGSAGCIFFKFGVFRLKEIPLFQLASFFFDSIPLTKPFFKPKQWSVYDFLARLIDLLADLNMVESKFKNLFSNVILLNIYISTSQPWWSRTDARCLYNRWVVKLNRVLLVNCLFAVSCCLSLSLPPPRYVCSWLFLFLFSKCGTNRTWFVHIHFNEQSFIL